MTASHTSFAPVAIVSRSGYDESFHHGAVVLLGAAGDVVASVGDADVELYPRSACKPVQADAMLGLGVELDGAELALACASHDGTDRHVEVVRRILEQSGLGIDALRNTPDLPIEPTSRDRVLAAGGGRTTLRQNCSGKHAAMLATCLVQGWSTDGYLDPDHPLQRAITERLVELAGPVTHIGVDGCGAPAHVVSLSGLARAFRALASNQGAVWRAMTTNPELVGGAARDVTRIMRLVPGLVAKDGAEGVFAAALPDGRAAAVKIADGDARAAGVVVAAGLRELGVDIDPGELGWPVLGHGRPVGEARPVVQFGRAR